MSMCGALLDSVAAINRKASGRPSYVTLGRANIAVRYAGVAQFQINPISPTRHEYVPRSSRDPSAPPPLARSVIRRNTGQFNLSQAPIVGRQMLSTSSDRQTLGQKAAGFRSGVT